MKTKASLVSSPLTVHHCITFRRHLKGDTKAV